MIKNFILFDCSNKDCLIVMADGGCQYESGLIRTNKIPDGRIAYVIVWELNKGTKKAFVCGERIRKSVTHNPGVHASSKGGRCAIKTRDIHMHIDIDTSLFFSFYSPSFLIFIAHLTKVSKRTFIV